MTNVDAQGISGKVNIVFLIIKRSELRKVVAAIQEHHPQAFYSLEDVPHVSRGVFPAKPLARRKPRVEEKGMLGGAAPPFGEPFRWVGEKGRVYILAAAEATSELSSSSSSSLSTPRSLAVPS